MKVLTLRVLASVLGRSSAIAHPQVPVAKKAPTVQDTVGRPASLRSKSRLESERTVLGVALRILTRNSRLSGETTVSLSSCAAQSRAVAVTSGQ